MDLNQVTALISAQEILGCSFLLFSFIGGAQKSKVILLQTLTSHPWREGEGLALSPPKQQDAAANGILSPHAQNSDFYPLPSPEDPPWAARPPCLSGSRGEDGRPCMLPGTALGLPRDHAQVASDPQESLHSHTQALAGN